MASAFSGILAYGFYNMKGLGALGLPYRQHFGPTEEEPDIPYGTNPGLAGWRWIVRRYPAFF